MDVNANFHCTPLCGGTFFAIAVQDGLTSGLGLCLVSHELRPAVLVLS